MAKGRPLFKKSVMIGFKNVCKEYGEGNVALQDVNLEINKGEFVFVLGHSGAGKSTFLKLILREEVASSGHVVINGTDLGTIKQKQIPYLRRSLGVVFQDFRLIPTMTVFDNVAFAMRVTNISEREIKKRVPYVLDLVGLSGKLKRLPVQLSGGEQQRVALARALVHSPPIIIADEPTGNIDPEMSVEIMELLRAINLVGTTVVVVTHEHDLAQRFSERIITIDHGNIVDDYAFMDEFETGFEDDYQSDFNEYFGPDDENDDTKEKYYAASKVPIYDEYPDEAALEVADDAEYDDDVESYEDYEDYEDFIEDEYALEEEGEHK